MKKNNYRSYPMENRIFQFKTLPSRFSFFFCLIYVMLIICNAFYVRNIHHCSYCHVQTGYCNEVRQLSHLIYLSHLTLQRLRTANIFERDPYLPILSVGSFSYVGCQLYFSELWGARCQAGRGAPQPGCCYQTMLLSACDLLLTLYSWGKICTYIQAADFKKSVYRDIYTYFVSSF